MNTVEILVLILMGFLILNYSIDSIKEGLVNSESGIDGLLKEIAKLNTDNSHRIDAVTKEFTETGEKYDILLKGMKSTSHRQDVSNEVKSHPSVKALPPSNPNATITPPKGPCPSKYGKINWNTIKNKEGFEIQSKLQKEHELQEKNVWLPGYNKEKVAVVATEEKIMSLVFLTVGIEDIGNLIQGILQKNKF